MKHSRSTLLAFWCPDTVFIVIPNLKVVLVTNRWYHESHYYFKYVPSGITVRSAPTVVVCKDLDPRSLFLNEKITLFEILDTKLFV